MGFSTFDASSYLLVLKYLIIQIFQEKHKIEAIKYQIY